MEKNLKYFHFGRKEVNHLSVGLLAIVLCYTMVLQGCSVAWVGTVDKLLAVAGPALNNIITIVALSTNKPVNQALEDKITQDSANLRKLAEDFAASTGANAPTACQELQAGVNLLNDDAATVLSIVQSIGPVGGNLPAIFAAADAIVISIVALIPSCTTPAALKLSIPKAAGSINVNGMIDAYNAVLTLPSGKLAVDKFAKAHKLPKHGKFMHIVTMDVVK